MFFFNFPLDKCLIFAVYFLWIQGGGGEMRTRIQKWGNSLALRIPKSFAAEVKLEQGSEIEVSLVDGKLVVG